MKTLLAVAFLSIALQSNSFAYEQSGPCSEASAKAALKYASESWQLSEKNQIIEYSFLNGALYENTSSCSISFDRTSV